MKHKRLAHILGFLALFLLVGQNAFAVQSHGGSEGLVSHQIGHFLFVIGMTYLLARIYSLKLRRGGWFEFKLFLWLLLLWNVITFSGHWMDEYVAAENFVRVNGSLVYFVIESPMDLVYYLSRLDHLVLVPSFMFLLLALRKWSLPQ